jgi:hypothetical protein
VSHFAAALVGFTASRVNFEAIGFFVAPLPFPEAGAGFFTAGGRATGFT